MGDFVGNWKCLNTNKEAKILCAQEMASHSAGCVRNMGPGERGVRRPEHHPKAKIHHRSVFKAGSRCFSEKKEVALDCFINSS